MEQCQIANGGELRFTAVRGLGGRLPQKKGITAMDIRFRSARYRELAERAFDQGFEVRELKSKHAGVICPTCGFLTILSTTQNDNRRDDHKYKNQVAYLRNHGLEMPGKKTKECIGNAYDNSRNRKSAG